MPQEKDSEQGTGEKTYVVRYRLPDEPGRNPRKVKVHARNQSDAIKAALATVPDAKIVGGPKRLDEGLVDFAKKVGRFLARCVGHGCFKYAEMPMTAKKDSVRAIRQRMTRELAQGAGNKMMQIGGGEESRAKIKFKKRKQKKKRSYKPRRTR